MRVLLFLLIFVFCGFNVFGLEITSPVFEPGAYIPAQYSCDADNVSPPLVWSEVPANTESFVLICDDPDAPFGTWVHWVVFNIPADSIQLAQGAGGSLPEPAASGLNDFGEIGYGGPCPPAGKPHRYFFKLYALDTTLVLEAGAKKKDVEKAMQGHILSEAKLTGLYRR